MWAPGQDLFDPFINMFFFGRIEGQSTENPCLYIYTHVPYQSHLSVVNLTYVNSSGKSSCSIVIELNVSFSIYNHIYVIIYVIILLLIIIITSSTAQGGGGSFKNRKPIGEACCCGAKMAERTHWWIERWLCVSAFLSAVARTKQAAATPWGRHVGGMGRVTFLHVFLYFWRHEAHASTAAADDSCPLLLGPSCRDTARQTRRRDG